MLKKRVLTALTLAPLVLLVILWLPHQATTGVLALLVLAGAWEWSAFPGFKSYSARVLYVCAVALCVAALWFLEVTRHDMSRVLAGALVWWVVALVWIALFPGWVSRSSTAVAGFLVLIPAWLALVRLHAHERQMLLFLLLLVVAADIGAYFGGRRFGRNKLAPKVSPGKTWEGVIGGLAAAALMTGIGIGWFKVSAMPFFVLCVIAVLASIVGDLTESLFKRHAGLKDSGTLLPGHGGVLDRVDSVTAAAPVFLIGLERLGLLR
jgi:phosphatidate cytidylyltransferase